MTSQELKLIIELIDAKIAEHNAADSSDSGLIESLQIMKIENELSALTVEDRE